MNLILNSITISLCFIFYTVVNAETQKPSKSNPFLVWKIMPKLLDKLREKFPNQNVEIFIPSLVKEIQQSIQVQQIDPTNMSSLIQQILDQFLQQINTIQKSTTAAPVNEQDSTPAMDKQMETPETKQEYRSLFRSVNDMSVPAVASQLPDLAFDRDPDRLPPSDEFMNADSKIDDGEGSDWDGEEGDGPGEPEDDLFVHSEGHDEHGLGPIDGPDDGVDGDDSGDVSRKQVKE
ncbi:uncharacterized protein LOC128963311 [Oppia nitens]|uniref:uncharacterized protein LOC128963311 n=1 Tax=Oppia nitens TaxID=1686743 RepID=UPI0023D9C308|nr:uncharacterized protein LOC128963311 [Oppia nitens]